MGASADDSFVIWFPFSGHAIDADFRGNGLVMDGLRIRLGELKATGVDTVYVALNPLSSPEGGEDANRVLSSRRGKAVEGWLLSLQEAPKMVISMQVGVSTWDDVKSVPLRNFRCCFITLSYDEPESESIAAEEPVDSVTVLLPEPVPTVSVEVSDVRVSEEPIPVDVPASRSTSWYLKTNFLTYPLNLTANLAVEVEIGRHVSVSVPFYYSAIDWFKNTIKFRMAGSQPEVRYWFRRNFTGFYVAGHATFGWYNVALGGRYRYQDHATNSPVFGGGINAGYRLPLGNSRWALEFSLGAGYLPLYYDTFYNVENGALAQEGLWKHYWGPDHAAVTLSYRFGKRRSHE